MPPFNINDFRSSFVLEPANPTNYEVLITKGPPIMVEVGGAINFANTLRYRCESCAIPSKSLLFANRKTYGPNRKVAYGAEYRDVSFSFIVSDNMQEKEYFDIWQRMIVDNDEVSGGITTHDASYYDDYIGEIEIRYYEKGGKNTYKIVLMEAYPIEVQEVPLSWTSNNEYMRVTVTLAYRDFYEERLF